MVSLTKLTVARIRCLLAAARCPNRGCEAGKFKALVWLEETGKTAGSYIPQIRTCEWCMHRREMLAFFEAIPGIGEKLPWPQNTTEEGQQA